MLKFFISLYLSVVVLLFVGVDFIESLFISAYKQELTEDLAKDYAGVFALMEALYPHLNETQWQQLIEDITARSNLPTESRPRAEWQLGNDALALLTQGKIYVENFADDVVFGEIADGVVVRMGPMQTIESVKDGETVFNLVVMAAVGLLVLAWAGWQQYKISRLARTTLEFSEGHLDVRADTGFLGMPVLSAAFNRMAERIQRLFQSHRHLTNAVSHELRSPVAKIRFQLELLNDSADQNETDRLMLGMSDDLDDMDALIEEMLTYARMERAEPDVHIETVALGEWVLEQTDRLKKEIATPLSTRVPDTAMPAQLDQLLMARLLRNLVCNAERYAEGKIEVGVERSDQEYRLWVDDDGPGIAPQERERLFEPFTRVDQSRNRESGGHGLGLAIVAQIARWHCGAVDIDESPLGGVRVVLSWPLVVENLKPDLNSDIDDR